MELLLTPAFARQIKKLHKNQKASLDRALRQLVNNRLLGDAKTAELKGVYVLKFKINAQEWLLAYRLISQESLKLLLVGPHENFYRELKKKP
jgi:mRNA-degrading endonuclease YafQ of YafQ-DinJ toxin-antitoxin module